MYITRIINYAGLPEEFVAIPPACYAVGINVGREEDLSYLMRLKRSFELQGAVN